MESSAPSLKRAPAAAPAHPRHRRAERLRNPRSLPAGRERPLPLGLSRRRRPLHLRRALQAGDDPARARAPRAGGGACGRRLCARDRRSRRRPRHLRAGRDQRGDRHRHGLHGLDPDGDRHRPGADAGDRPRRLPGMRHRRHHAADRQAQLPRQGRARPGGDDEEGVPHRPHRPARAGRRRRAEGRLDGARAVPLPGERRDALVQPGEEGPRRPDPEGGAAAARRQAALHLHRRRRRPRQRVGRAARARRPARLSLHQHADGPRRLPGERPEVPRHARHARHLRSEHDDAELRRPARRRRALRRSRDRQPEALRLGRAQDHPHRHRPVVDLQAGARRRADRRRREGRAAGAHGADPRSRRRSPTSRRSRRGGRRSTSGASGLPGATPGAAR